MAIPERHLEGTQTSDTWVLPRTAPAHLDGPALVARDVLWTSALIQEQMCLGRSNFFYVVVMNACVSKQAAQRKLEKAFRRSPLEVDWSAMEAMDRYGTELLGLSPWPKPSPEFQGEFGPYKVDSELHLRLRRLWRG